MKTLDAFLALRDPAPFVDRNPVGAPDDSFFLRDALEYGCGNFGVARPLAALLSRVCLIVLQAIEVGLYHLVHFHVKHAELNHPLIQPVRVFEKLTSVLKER